jgi:hypothetical protein
MLNSKGFLFLFLIHNTSKGYTYLKQSSGSDTQFWKPSNKSKAGVCFSLCLYRYIQRLGYVKIKYHKGHHMNSTA